jgi:hypothetical protein
VKVPNAEWFKRLAEHLDGDEDYLEVAKWLRAAVLVEIGETAFTLYFHKGRLIDVEEGRAITGTDFSLTGPEDEWSALASGQIDYGRATTPPVGHIRIGGNQVLAAGNTQALSQWCARMPLVPQADVEAGA